MFRARRPFRRRPLLRRLAWPGLRPGLTPAVVEAERLMQEARYAQAAERFAQLAHNAAERAIPKAAGELFLRAARCYAETNSIEQADYCTEQAIHLFIQARRPRRVHQVLRRVVTALECRGRHNDAERLRREVEQAFRGMGPLVAAMPAPARRGQLPVRCPSCGGPLKPDEVARSDPNTAECPYCGGVVSAE